MEAARYVVVIDDAGRRVARVYDGSRVLVAEFDASAKEARALTDGLLAERTAAQPEWDRALEGFTPQARDAAEVYTLGD